MEEELLTSFLDMKGAYVDGFVFPVPKKKLAAYKKMASEGAAAWMRFGALAYYECMGDDLKIKGGAGMPAPRSFLQLVKVKPTETAWFSFIIFKNRKHRDTVNKKVMAYMGKKYAGVDFSMPFDPRKMTMGGFKAVIAK
jgi:uncharacterized protein YbaA (DUF1428 family)